MESYGAILKKVREDKGLELETIAREISITQEYLTALENEDSEVFPGEPYLVGFLQNYACVWLEFGQIHRGRLSYNKSVAFWIDGRHFCNKSVCVQRIHV